MGTDRSTKCDRGAGIKSGDGGERFTAMPVGTDRSTKCNRGAGIKSGDGGEHFTAMPGNKFIYRD
jgi:hypothetical protein